MSSMDPRAGGDAVDGGRDPDANFQLAKSASSEGVIFTNCGNAEPQQRPVKSAKPKITRVPFRVSRLMEFCNRRELINQTGHDAFERNEDRDRGRQDDDR
jgi:hypothetical protein